MAAALRAARLGAGDPALLLHAGRRLRACGAVVEAMGVLRRAVGLDPGLAEAWYALGLLLGDARQHAAAAEAFRAALRARPGLHEAAFNLGVALAEGGDLDGAMDAYALALRLRPDTLGRIAQALVSAPCGCLFLDPAALRAALAGRVAPAF